MKIVTCASYYGCGSSAITDMISEFNGVKSLTNYEFRFIHDIDGLSDLEFHLVQCPNRHNSGHALKRFEKVSKFYAGRWFNKRYEPFFNNQYMRLTNEYIESLLKFKHNGFWFFDMYDRGTNVYYLYSLLSKLYKAHPCRLYKPLANEKTYFSHPSEDEFLKYTREYIHKLLQEANNENQPYLLVDQILPSSNINRCLRYFSDKVYLFVVDRDPRDIYLSEKYYWHESVAPTETPEAFCDWYRYARECAKGETYDNTVVMKLQFEDMIYKYDDIKEKIMSFCGLSESDHIRPFSKFNPKRSVGNTQIWVDKPELAKEIKIIEELLPEYLYDFNGLDKQEVVGIETSNHKVF